MENFKKIDNEFYGSKYGLPRVGDPNEIWKKIKDNKDLLNWAIKPTKNRFNERDIVNGLAICDTILADYSSIDKNIYQELVNLIYSNEQIARIVQGGYSNGGCSYLLMTLWNPNLKLTEEQKQFAVNEAMNKIGTTKYKKEQEKYSKKLDEQGITNDITTTVDIDGCINPIGAKTKSEYFNFINIMLSSTQVHGTGEFDIRYCILRNPNWTLEEKQKLIMDFWYDADVYDECLEQWEWSIVNDPANDKENSLPQFDKSLLYEYSYDELLAFYADKATTDRIWDEIQFCKQMHILRPQQWELNYSAKILQKI
jgi:hypothetical protein